MRTLWIALGVLGLIVTFPIVIALAVYLRVTDSDGVLR